MFPNCILTLDCILTDHCIVFNNCKLLDYFILFHHLMMFLQPVFLEIHHRIKWGTHIRTCLHNCPWNIVTHRNYSLDRHMPSFNEWSLLNCTLTHQFRLTIASNQNTRIRTRNFCCSAEGGNEKCFVIELHEQRWLVLWGII